MDNMDSHTDGLARDTAMLEPFPERSLEMMEGILREAQARGGVTEVDKKAGSSSLPGSSPAQRTCETYLIPYRAS